MAMTRVLALGLLTFCAAIGTYSQRLQVLETLSTLPSGWTSVGRPSLYHRLPFRIALHAQNPVLLHQAVLEVSDPDSERYGQHLSKADLIDIMKPASLANERITEWLTQSGVLESDIEQHNDWIHFNTTVETAAKMLNSTFQTFVRDDTGGSQHAGEVVIRTLQYSVPERLHDIISFVSPTIHFPSLRPRLAIPPARHLVNDLSLKGTGSGPCNGSYNTPFCLRQLYNISGFTPQINGSGYFAINGFLEEYARYTDLEKFLATFDAANEDANFTWVSVNGGQLNQSVNTTLNSAEAQLDIEYAVSLTYPLPNTFLSVGGRPPRIPSAGDSADAPNTNEPYLDLLEYLLSLDDGMLPHTISNSYSEPEQSVPLPYARKVCDMIGALGARGVSFLTGSGDDGPGFVCVSNDGTDTLEFLPEFPSSCPYVTSVGGTTGNQPEKAWGASGGGFSNYFGRPSYQEEAVQSYFEYLGDKEKGYYNASGRGIPDVSAQATFYQYVDKGRVGDTGGTSASTPVFASIIALLNAGRLQDGNKPLGFLNPWLYGNVSSAQALNDITLSGSSGCFLNPGRIPDAEWNATEGWDPVTGLGTPDFGKLLALVCAGS